MKYPSIFLTIALTLCGSWSQAARTVKILEVRFEKDKKVHLFTIEQGINSKKFKEHTLTFKATNLPTKKVRLQPRHAEQLVADATQIVWKNEYRRPASLKSCTEYVSLKTTTERAQVCQENRQATGRAFAFMNNLDRLIR